MLYKQGTQSKKEEELKVFSIFSSLKWKIKQEEETADKERHFAVHVLVVFYFKKWYGDVDLLTLRAASAFDSYFVLFSTSIFLSASPECELTWILPSPLSENGE